jgi:hypothetical protein
MDPSLFGGKAGIVQSKYRTEEKHLNTFTVQLAFDQIEIRIFLINPKLYLFEFNPVIFRNQVYSILLPLQSEIKIQNTFHFRYLMEKMQFSQLQNSTTILIQLLEESFPHSLCLTLCEVESHIVWSHNFKIDHSHNQIISLNSIATLVKQIISHENGILRDKEKAHLINKLGIDSFPTIEISSEKEVNARSFVHYGVFNFGNKRTEIFRRRV